MVGHGRTQPTLRVTVRWLGARLLVVLALAMLAGACEADNPFEPCPVYSTGVVGGCPFDPDGSE